jgi:hypothetical protein
MIKNYFFLSAGVVALIGASGHSFVGHQTVLPEIETEPVRHIVFILLHQTTWFMLASAFVFFVGALLPIPKKINSIAGFIVLICLGNLVFYIVSSLILDKTIFTKLLPQIVFLLVYLGLIVGGIRKSYFKVN